MDELSVPLRRPSSRYNAVPDSAIELEHARDLSSESCLLAIRPADKSLSVRTACLVALGLSYVVALSAIAVSVYLGGASKTPYDNWVRSLRLSSTSRTVVDLALSAMVTLCTEAMGYIHSVSLRWALRREHRLQYSSNLRLLTGARRSWPNSLWANTLSAIALVLSYAGASQTLVPVVYHGDVRFEVVLVNGPALLFLGLGLLVQAFLSTACVIKDSARISTWSSNPLTVALACLQEHDSLLQRQEGRCLQSAYDTVQATGTDPVRPYFQQPSMRLTDPSVRYITRFLWSLTVAASVWAIAATVLVAKLPKQPSWTVGYFPSIWLPGGVLSNLVLAFIIVAVFQGFATLGLHSVELLVTRSRDEQCWRHANASSQVPKTLKPSRIRKNKKYNSITAALTSWQSLCLYVLKPLTHWLFGSGLSTRFYSGAAMGYMDFQFLLGLAAVVLVLAIFSTVLSHHRPKGVMPSSWGHIQTLANLIDDWADGDVQDLKWGDKGCHEDGTRRAGTAVNDENVGEIVVDELYR